MARLLRTEFAGARYPAASHGDGLEDIYPDAIVFLQFLPGRRCVLTKSLSGNREPTAEPHYQGKRQDLTLLVVTTLCTYDFNSMHYMYFRAQLMVSRDVS